MTTKMKVVDMDSEVIKQYIAGCKYSIRKDNMSGSFIEGNNRGIDDGLKLLDDEEDLTFVMRMAILGLRHEYDRNVNDDFYSRKDEVYYSTGYDNGLTNTVKVIAGEEFMVD
jgi:hypothetical protein